MRRRRQAGAGRPWAAALGALLAGGCSLGAPDPIPLKGPAPRSILVLPVKPVDPPGGVAPALLATIGPELRGRGYDPIPIAAGFSQLEALGHRPDRAYPVEDYAAAAREIGADAFLSMRVEQWQAIYAPRLVHLTHDIGYRLWDAETGALLWELRSHDRWDWSDDEDAYQDPSTELEQYLGPIDRAKPSSPYRDDVDTARAIHRRSMAYLPVRLE